MACGSVCGSVTIKLGFPLSPAAELPPISKACTCSIPSWNYLRYPGGCSMLGRRYLTMKWALLSSFLYLQPTADSSLTPIACSTNNVPETHQRCDHATSRRSPDVPSTSLQLTVSSTPFEKSCIPHSINVADISVHRHVFLSHSMLLHPFLNLYPPWRLCSFITLSSATTHQSQNAGQTSSSITRLFVCDPRRSHPPQPPQLQGHLQEVDPYRAFLCSERSASAPNVGLPHQSKGFERSRASRKDEAPTSCSPIAMRQYRALQKSSAPASYAAATRSSALPEYPVTRRGQQAAAQYVLEWTAYWDNLVPNSGNNNDERGKSV